MNKHIITKIGLLDAQVCSIGTYEEALHFLQHNSPAGTQNNWQIHKDGTFAPVKCADNKERTHYMFNC